MVPFLRRKLQRVQKWQAQGVAFACTVPALVLPHALPALFGHSVYLMGVTAVVIAAGLADLWVTIALSAMILVNAIFVDIALHLGVAEIGVRIGIFLVMTVLVSLGAWAFHRFAAQDDQTVSDLRRNEAVMRTVIETGLNVMLMIDDRGLLLSYSPAAEALFGWTPDEVIGRNVSVLMPSRQGEHDGYIERYLTTGERQIIGKSREVTGLRKDGAHFPMMLQVGEVAVDNERRFTGFIHDLTALRAAHDRTQELSDQLTHMWNIYSLGEMASVLAHELNQPLAAVTNYMRGAGALIARLELKDDEILKALERAGDQAIRAGEIIRRMRSLVTRKEADRRPENLAQLISEISFMIDLASRDGGVVVRYRLTSGPPALADRIQVQQVMMNLARNAVEAMRGREERVLTISTERADRSWIIRLEDTGPGLTEESLARLFQPMQSDKVQGMGLGLSISRTIIEAHGGTIWAEHAPLGGAVFCFSIPEAPQEMAQG